MCQWKCVAFSQLLSPVHRTRTKTKNYYHHIYSALSATGNFYWLWKRKTVSRTELITYKHSRDRIEKQLWANSCQRWSSAFTTQISHPGKTRLPAMVRWWGQIKTSTETEGETSERTESGKKKVASLPKNEINVRCLDISFYRIFINVYKYCVSFFSPTGFFVLMTLNVQASYNKTLWQMKTKRNTHESYATGMNE